MSCNQDIKWEYIPVETADEIMLCGDMVESKRLKNWNRWLKIRKQQHKYLGLMVCRKPTSLLMNESDKFRSKVECKWLVDVALKLKVNNEYHTDFPHSLEREINKFTSVYVPDVIRTEKGLLGIRKDARFNLQTPNKVLIHNELNTLKSLIPFKNPKKLAIIGESILKKAMKYKLGYKGTIPSVYVESAHKKNNDCNIALIIVRVNDYIIKSIDDSTKCMTLKLKTKSKPINIVKLNEDSWDEIIIENCGQISIYYKWIKEEYTTSKYDNILKEKPKECFFFDTRTNILGPGQIQRLTVLFRPTQTGPHREIWFIQLNILGRLDYIAKIKVPLQGCGIHNVDNISSIIKLQNTILSEKVNGLFYDKSINKDRENVFLENNSSFIKKYHYHDEKMKYLYHILQTEDTKDIEELLYQCMQLKQSLKEICLDLISQTAVTLLKKEIFFEHGQMTQHELNAHKTMYITMDCIDLIMSTYETDHYEVCQELYNNFGENKPKSVKYSDDKISAVDTTMEQNTEFATMSEEWFEMVKPMIKKRLEWAVERISDYDILWAECKHENHNETLKNEHTRGIESYEQKECSLSLVRQFYINKYL